MLVHFIPLEWVNPERFNPAQLGQLNAGERDTAPVAQPTQSDDQPTHNGGAHAGKVETQIEATTAVKINEWLSFRLRGLDFLIRN